MKTAPRLEKCAGFNLVEVCLAIVVVAFGIVTLLGLFSSGLRTIDTADNETRLTMFAGGVMNGILANAAGITNWSVWANDSAFSSAVCTDLIPTIPPVTPSWVSGGTVVEYPTGSTLYLRYKLSVTTLEFTRGRAINLEVVPDRYGHWTNPIVFHTIVSFLGM